jgi:hypothetical protein
MNIRHSRISVITAVAKAVHYVRAAQKDEHNGFRYAAAMEWQLAAGLFPSNTFAAEYCWSQWERILSLPRQLAGSIGDSRPVVCKERTSVMQSEMARSNDKACLATAV